jgi:predicted nucleic acid-binding protein
MTTVIDTDALLGLFNPLDEHHARSKAFMERLKEQTCEIVILPTTLGEFALLATSRIILSRTRIAVQILSGPEFRLYEVNSALTEAAISTYYQQTSKKESLFDCFVMEAAKATQADCVFSFDHGYRKNHLRLIEDVVQL